MKKSLILLIVIVILSIFFLTSKEKSIPVMEEEQEMKAVFISYLELDTYIQDKTEEESKQNIEKIIQNMSENHFNTLLLQVRSHDDAIYPSKVFPTSKSIILKNKDSYDVLKYFLVQAKKKNITVYLWINPFRITRRGEELIKDTFPYQYKDTSIVKKIGDTYYYNPAREEVVNHILTGIDELIRQYSFQGILFDDYFYPNNDIDQLEYEEQVKDKEKVSIKKFHLDRVNYLIKKVYQEVKRKNKNIEFGISPDGNIENNYQKNFADVKKWTEEDNYVDFIMPQLYYGFCNSTKPFYETMTIWNNLIQKEKVKLYYALAFYKTGKKDLYAKEGVNEWIDYSDIIKREILLARNTSHYGGFSLFRYDSLFSFENENAKKEFENIKTIIQ